MGDIDWSKRRPEYDFGGMGDADWGWSWGQKKRSDESLDEERSYDFGMSDADWGWSWGQKKRSDPSVDRWERSPKKTEQTNPQV